MALIIVDHARSHPRRDRERPVELVHLNLQICDLRDRRLDEFRYAAESSFEALC
jgi:hypothetical protein